MSATLRWDGLDELRLALRNMPQDLTAEAAHIVEGAANGAEVDIRAEYNQVTGNLRDGLRQTHFEDSKFSVGVLLKSTSPHAWLWDNGSEARHWASGKSTGTMWGKTPPQHTFVRTVVRARRRMYEQLQQMLERHGLTVTGDAR